jgi:hypothetical protein
MKSLITTLFVTATLLAGQAQANDSSYHSGQASKHSVLASSTAVQSTAQVASAVVAVPLVVAGVSTLAVGSAIAESGQAIADSHVHSHAPTPVLIITDKVITADPAPNQAMKNPQGNR